MNESKKINECEERWGKEVWPKIMQYENRITIMLFQTKTATPPNTDMQENRSMEQINKSRRNDHHNQLQLVDGKTNEFIILNTAKQRTPKQTIHSSGNSRRSNKDGKTADTRTQDRRHARQSTILQDEWFGVGLN